MRVGSTREVAYCGRKGATNDFAKVRGVTLGRIGVHDD
jgi:hypothetical protein